MTVPRIGVTLGDPGGVGPEIVLKALAGDHTLPTAAYVLFGNSQIVAGTARTLDLRFGLEAWGPERAGEPGIFLSEIPSPADDPAPARPDAKSGEASFRFFEAALDAARSGALEAVVTAPVSKSAWKLAGIPWRGHTERLESLYPGAIMSFWSEKLKVALLSHHLPLREALGRVRRDILLDFFRALSRSTVRIRGGPREFLVAGLNPHAGEDGLLGGEEEGEIRPAIKTAREEGLNVSGPYPPDTVFRLALGRPDVMVVALYHDQGLVAFKLEAFESGVNATLGLPFVRTSPDHGTAFDIAGRGVASPLSMVEAIRLAGRFTASAS
ncbi:MAG: 4-hydroxythreonine-4-phosphate dehydrogenase PdxA [Candidatus Aminicenantales bacterium]|jgi:4-hydroxythreonine-4-phosphate dehydrogenase